MGILSFLSAPLIAADGQNRSAPAGLPRLFVAGDRQFLPHHQLYPDGFLVDHPGQMPWRRHDGFHDSQSDMAMASVLPQETASAAG